ncbi:MAG: right-handed parallel beta-helix repeat-containing protein [Candidatus Thorarchaeota archaeon]|jgi:parallel beta-helix repeat protein
MRKGYGALLLMVILFLGVSISQTNPIVLQRGIQRSVGSVRSFHYATQVTDYQHYVNTTITISEWIYVANGGNLVIENCTVVFTSDEMAIVGQEGGSLTIKDSYLYSFTDCSWWITGEVGSHLLMSGSELLGSGTKEHGALKIYTDDATITDCTFTRFGGDIMSVQDCENTLIVGNSISQSSKEGINVVGTSGTHIVNNSISDTGFCGIYAFGVNNLVIEKNTFENTTFNGIVFVNSDQCLVDNNLFENIVLDGVGMEYCNDMIISNNTILDSDSSGIGSMHSTNLTISGNFISGVQWNGIDLHQYTEDAKIELNEIRDSEMGVVLSATFDVLVSGNLIESITYLGVNVQEDCEKVAVIGNSVFDCEVGISVQNQQNMTVIGNLINESFYSDIRIESSSDIDVYLNGFCSNIRNSGNSIASLIKWHNDTLGNYWYHYQGIDENNDGIGDSMYVIDEGDYDFYPLMSIEPVIEFLQDYVIPTSPWETQTTIVTTNESPFMNNEQLEIYLLTNSIIQLTGISLVVVVIFYRSRLYDR